MTRVTASKTGLLEHCQAFAKPGMEWFNGTSPAADRGTRFHRAIAEYTSHGSVRLLEEDIVDLFVQARAWVDAFGRERVKPEVAYAWNPATDEAEHIPAAERDYRAGHGRLCGTADLVAVSNLTRTGIVWDWKTGSGANAGPQLRTLGLMVARAHGLKSVTVAALEVTAAGVQEVCREELDEFALSAIAGELAERLAAVATAEPQPGEHCRDLYCPARVSCPATRESEAQLVPAESLTKRLSTTIDGPDHAVWMLERVRLVEAACKAVKDAIKAYVPADGLVLEDGSRLMETTREMPRFDKNKALALLKQLGATPAQVDALTYKWTESAGLKVVGGAAKSKPRSRRTKAA
jgi:hypothetical protein